MDHFYVYEFKNGRYLFDRTCGTEPDAIRRVEELKGRGVKAVCLINHVILGAMY